MGEDHRRSPRSRRRPAGPRRRPLRPRQGQGTHRRIPGGAKAEGGSQGTNSLFRRTARRGQDVPRPVDRTRHEPEVRAALSRRRARRGRDSRTPAHLHRLDAWTDRPVGEVGGQRQSRVDAGRDRQDVRGYPGGSGRRAARGPRPGAEPHVPRSLSRDPAESVAGLVHRDGQPARHRPPGAAGPDGAHHAQRVHRGRKGAHRSDVPRAPTARRARAQGRAVRHHRPGAPARDRRVHARGRRAHVGAADRDDRPKGRSSCRHGAVARRARRRAAGRHVSRPAAVSTGNGVPHLPSRRGDGGRVDGGRRRRAVRRSGADAGRQRTL